MLMLTKNAADAIKRLTGAPGAEGVRISKAGPSLAPDGPGLQIELVGEAEPEDAVVEAEGSRIFLAPEAAEAMEGKVLDADVESDAVRFAVLVEPESQAEVDDPQVTRNHNGAHGAGGEPGA